MSIPRMLAVCSLLLSGCLYDTRADVDHKTRTRAVRRRAGRVRLRRRRPRPKALSLRLRRLAVLKVSEIVPESSRRRSSRLPTQLRSPMPRQRLRPAANSKFQVPQEIPGSETPQVPYVPFEHGRPSSTWQTCCRPTIPFSSPKVANFRASRISTSLSPGRAVMLASTD